MHRALALALLASLVGGACATGAGGAGGADSGTTGRDSSTTPGDGGTDARDGGGRRDSGTSGTCLDGQHACGGGCIDDQPNEPANGCRLGCGESCTPPPNGTATCTPEGTCDFTCAVPHRRQGDQCVCAPRTCEMMGAECGAPDDGCGMPLDCGTCDAGNSCIDGRCACTPDAREPNDSSSAAPNLGTYADGDDPDITLTEFGLDDASDADWFAFNVRDDNTDNADITVTLSGIPAGSDYDVVAFFACEGGSESTDCTEGNPLNLIGNGCEPATNSATSERVLLATDCDRGIDIFNANDSGTLFVRVTSRTWGGSCEPYRLEINIR